MQKLRKRRDSDLMHLFAFISALTQLSEQLVRRFAFTVRLARHVYLHDVVLMRAGEQRARSVRQLISRLDHCDIAFKTVDDYPHTITAQEATRIIPVCGSFSGYLNFTPMKNLCRPYCIRRDVSV